MLTLTLLRHAKSDWNDDSLDDFDRPLAPRGKKAAPLIGKALNEIGPAVDLVLCSPSKRTRQTIELVLKELTASPSPSVRYERDLYHGLPQHILEQIIGSAGNAHHVVVVGHNPGLEILASHLAQDGAADDMAAMATKFPTAALAQLTFPCETWAECVNGSGTLTHFITPRSLQ